MLQHPPEIQAEQTTVSRGFSINAAFASIWRWSKLQTPPRTLYWCSLYTCLVLIQSALYLPLFLSFFGYAFRDGGSGLAADDLIRRGLLPAVDFGYYHGLLPLMLARPWFAVFGTTPQAYVGFRFVVTILSSILMFYLFRAVRAPRIMHVMFCAAIPFIFFYRPSINHDLAALGITLSLLLLVSGRYAGAVSAALASAFCHPSLGYVMLLVIGVTVGWPALRTSPLALLRIASRLIGAAIATLAVFAAACLAFFGSVAPLLRTLFPTVGKGMRSHYGWSFLKGGLTFIHPPGSNWKYLIGSNAGPYVLFNVALAAVALVALAQLIRKRSEGHNALLTLFFASLVIHAVYVIFVYGVPETWAYDTYLLVLGVAAVPFSRVRHLAGLVLTGALLIGSFSALSASSRQYRQPRRGGLWIDARLEASLANILQRQPQGTPYVWSMAGALSMIDDRIQSPARWFVVPGGSPPAELARLKGELLGKSLIFLEGSPDSPNYLFQNPDFDDVAARFHQVGSIDDFTVCARQP